MEDTKLLIRKHGAPRVNDAAIHRRGLHVVAIGVDMASKRCTVDGFMSMDDIPGVMIGTDEHSLHLAEGVDREQETVVAFPEFNGWSVWSANVMRYTLYVCLIKEDP